MPSSLGLVGSVVLLLAGVWAMQRGAGLAGDVVDRVRRRLGYPEAAGGAFMGLATATPEISINLSSVVFGWPDLGLGAALGSNIPALPLAILLSFLAVKFATRPAVAEGSLGEQDAETPRVKAAAVPVQFAPYLLVVILLGALTLPPPWAGLQPVDAVILLAAFAAYALQALSRHQRGERVPGQPRGRLHLLLALPLIGAGAVASVWGGQQIGRALGLPDLVTGLFVIGFLCALPESVSAWRFARAGHTTFGVSAACADGVVSLTLALIPTALKGSELGDRALYVLNLGFLGAVLIAYILMNNGRLGERLNLARVAVFGAGYVGYLIVTVSLLAGK
jgi:cation:H+ antiporter